jgi:hypothetical protein
MDGRSAGASLGATLLIGDADDFSEFDERDSIELQAYIGGAIPGFDAALYLLAKVSDLSVGKVRL